MHLGKSPYGKIRIRRIFVMYSPKTVAGWLAKSNAKVICKHYQEYFDFLRHKYHGCLPFFRLGANEAFDQVFPTYTLNQYLLDNGYIAPERKPAKEELFQGGGSTIHHHGWYGADYYGEDDSDRYMRIIENS